MNSWIWFAMYVGVAILVSRQVLRDFRGCDGRAFIWAVALFFGALWLPVLFLILLSSGFEIASKHFKGH